MLLRRHHGDASCMIVEFVENAVGVFIQFLHDFALHILSPCAAQDLNQTGAGGAAGNDLGSQCNVVEDVGERAGSARVAFLLIEDEPLDGDDLVAIGIVVLYRVASEGELAMDISNF
ncbi:MAG: hypothetical protein R2856_39220 [Caldilineaceae bacterium]